MGAHFDLPEVTRPLIDPRIFTTQKLVAELEAMKCGPRQWLYHTTAKYEEAYAIGSVSDIFVSDSTLHCRNGNYIYGDHPMENHFPDYPNLAVYLTVSNSEPMLIKDLIEVLRPYPTDVYVFVPRVVQQWGQKDIHTVSSLKKVFLDVREAQRWGRMSKKDQEIFSQQGRFYESWPSFLPEYNLPITLLDF